MRGVERRTGPSENDSLYAQANSMPGIVCDYSKDVIDCLDPLDSPHKYTTYGPYRRDYTMIIY